jgi:hypothetical protein
MYVSTPSSAQRFSALQPGGDAGAHVGMVRDCHDLRNAEELDPVHGSGIGSDLEKWCREA